MKIAVPVFGDRVSPRFDYAPEFLLVSVTEKGLGRPERLRTLDWTSRRRVRLLFDQGVEAVICGAIDRCTEETLRHAGVAVHGWQTGGIDDVMQRIEAGELLGADRSVGEARAKVPASDDGRDADSFRRGERTLEVARLRNG
jgi:predicted Fe-Mo cluster-binding NifX family protein